MSEPVSDNIPEEARHAADHLKRAKGAKAFGDDATAQANIEAAWLKLNEAVEKELKKGKKTS
jgi:hypothetical protein